MLNIAILLALLSPALTHIYTTTPKVSYDSNGNPSIYHLYVSLQSGLGASDYLQILWGQQLYVSAKSQIRATLISYSNYLQVASATFNPQSASGSSSYFVSFGTAITPNTWYQIQIFPTKTPVTTPISYLFQLYTLSSIAANSIIYDSNLAAGYVNIRIPLAVANTLTVICNSTSFQATIPGTIYSYDMYITPSINSSAGANFTISIFYSNAVASHNTGTTLTDFQFMGLCQATPTATDEAAVIQNCKISSDLTTLTFSMTSITAGTTIRISTSVNNPLYVSVRGISVYWVDKISGQVKENNKINTALTVSTIPLIAPTNGRIYLLWGIDYLNPDSNLVPALKIFKAADSTLGPYNAFNIGFQFSQTSPSSGLYTVQIVLQATGILQASIAHNLPAYNGQSVVCQYSTILTAIVCTNVGAFIRTSYRYFVSGKAYYASTTAATLTNFASVSITPVVYDINNNLLPNAALYTPLAGVTIAVQTSTNFLDPTGYHGLFKMGNTQVVSYTDDYSLSSTANAALGFLKGTNSTVGIVPTPDTTQQLLFLMNVPQAKMTTGSLTDKNFQTLIFFNPQAINFEVNASSRGIDFAGYSAATNQWSISYSNCYKSGVACEKYSTATPVSNTKIIVNQANAYDFYGMYNFQCGAPFNSTACASNCAAECNLLNGYGTTDYTSGVISMRQVILNLTHTSLYADNSLLDFLFVFMQGGVVVSSSLINGYTLTGAPLQNIKAAYVNYYDNGAGSYNKGVRIPMMLRIGGGILPQQSLNATLIGLFVDDAVDASTFYTSIGNSFTIGCSTANCLYYPNLGLANIKNDLWLANKAIIVNNLPPIQNEFNILVPVTPSSLHTPPKSLTIAFFTMDYSIGDATNLLRTISVYRVYGAAVTTTLSGSITTINSLATGGSTPDVEMSADNYPASNYITVALNTTNMYSNPTNNTFTAGNPLNPSFGTSFGAGYTISSFFYNIFASSTLAFNSPPSNTATTCTQFGYVYNQIQNNLLNLYKNQQWIYVSFCPIDTTFDTTISAANINFLNPQYPTVFTNAFPLKSVLAIGFSLQSGLLASYRKQTTPINTLIRSCTTSKLNQYNPSTTGTQRATFTLSVPQIVVSKSYSGYPSFRVNFAIPPSTIGTSNFAPISLCDCSISSLSCSAQVISSTSVVMTLTYTGTSTLTVTYLQLNLYATIPNALSSAANYVLTVYLPQQISTDFTPFGNAYTTLTTYCTCSSSFTVGLTSSGSVAALASFTTSSLSNNVNSPFSLTFGAGPNSFRDTFYLSSTFQFNFGFISDVALTAYNNGNLRCLIYQSNALSFRWSTFSITLPLATLSPKTQINNPKALTFNMTCYGATTPNSLSTPITLTWMDSGNTMQTAPSLTLPTTFLGTPLGTLTVTISKKRFRTEGSKSLYSFQVTCNQPLDTNSRFYIDFHMALSSRLDNEGFVECYTRDTTIIDTDALFTYCTLVAPWQLLVWNNRVLPANTPFHIDVYNVDQPKVSNINAMRYIAFMADADSDRNNGVIAKTTILDNANALQAVSTTKIITILSVSTTNVYIRVAQTITINFQSPDTLIFSGGNFLYVLLPSSYSQLIARATTITCNLTQQGQSINFATTNIFISQRILKITVSPTTATLYTLSFTLSAPSTIPSGKLNEYSFKLFCSDAGQNYYTYYSFNDLSAALTLISNPLLIDLRWIYYSITVSDSLIQLTTVPNAVIVIQTAYYAGVIELRQSIYPANFKANLLLTLLTHNSTSFSFSTTLSTTLGKPTTYLRIAANSLSPGLYTLQFSKSTDSLYANIPPLTLVVQNTPCTLLTNSLSYTLPLGGRTLPLIIDAINCLPLAALTLSMTFSSPQLTLNTDLSTKQLLPTSLDGKVYLVVQHSGNLTAGSIVTANISFSGPNAPYYNPILNIQFTLVSATTFNNFPTATSLATPILLTNTATFTLQCNAAATIYWGLGIYPSLLTSQAVDFQARIVSALNGLLTNFTEPLDANAVVYGMTQATTMQVITKTLYNLKSTTQYLFKYFCVNQIGLISDAQTSTFTSNNYGAYLMKVSVTFRSSLSYAQYNNLACSLATNFILPYPRVMTEAMSYCGNTPFLFYPNSSSLITNQPDSSANYVYGFYILPDYSQGSDPTNTNIRSALSLNSFATTVITSTTNNSQLPSFVQMQTQDIQIFTTPSLTLANPTSGLNSIVLPATITNMNGFIVMGLLNGIFNASTMTLPTAIQLKQGLFTADTPLLNTKMLFAAQNYNVTFTFAALAANTTYSIFYFATAEDPQITAIPTTVGVVYAQTLSLLVIDINHAAKLTLILLLILLIL